MRVDIGQILTAIYTFLFGMLEVLLGFRLLLKLFAANSSALFTQWIYSSTDSLTMPFQGVFQSFRVGKFVFEISTVLAMIVYAIIGFIFFQLIKRFEGFVLKSEASKNPNPIIQTIPEEPATNAPETKPITTTEKKSSDNEDSGEQTPQVQTPQEKPEQTNQ